ncbi:MFS transporter [Fodinicola acaciae]|uniref:MFS transporter n=1 Tax=Fodinicola acaciae TaxID=2681555 RepID=UPI0013D310C5|nr:MFS transporter [Fodinicola acaciae]
MTEAPPATYRSVFAVAEFRNLWLAHILSVAGDQLARVALTVLVFDRTKSAGLAALTYAISFVPDLVGGALLSGVADRYSRRAVMVVADVARAALVAVMALGGLPLAGQVVLLVAVQLLAVPFSAARSATLPNVLEGDRLIVGVGLINMTYQLGLVLGFAAGGAVVAAIGVNGALLADAGTFVVSASVIGLGIRRHLPSRTAESRPSWWHTTTAGLRIVAGHPRLRLLVRFACLSGFFVVPEGLAVPYAAQIGVGAAGVGLLLAANPVGTVAGMLALKAVRPDRRLRLLGPLAVATCLVLLPTWLAPGLALSALLWTVSGVASAHDMITNATFVQTAPDHVRGQAVGFAVAALRASQGFAIVIGGLLAQLWRPAAVIGLAAAAGVVTASVIAVRWSRVVGRGG